MRQEASNTFSEGLNYDLNPTTTPNNVLTDCVNGTFLTFNGDELALQNDAGNTVIPTPVGSATLYNPLTIYTTGDTVYTNGGRFYECISTEATPIILTDTTVWKESAVRLSEGFYPIGIKEYGGVLYIVSAKQPDIIPTEFNNATTYAADDIVYTHIIDTDYYYQSLKNNNNAIVTETEFWLYVGLEKDFINKYGFIEFGSYPSPEIVNSDIFNTSLDYNLINEIGTNTDIFKYSLYSPKVINTSNFRAGVYVQFDANLVTLNTDAITFRAFTYDPITRTILETQGHKAIYKVKLLHQLANGFVDLTTDIWEKYAKFVKLTYNYDLNADTIEGNYWFSDPNFKYYCPHNYKGKLVLSVELEELDVFELDTLSITTNITNDYLFTFGINYIYDAGWNIGVSDTLACYYTLDGSDPDYTIIPPILPTTLVENQSTTFTLTFPSTDKDKILRYKILPEFYYETIQLGIELFPQQFLDMHTIKGSQIISSEADDFGILVEADWNNCEIPNTGYRFIERLSLVNSANEFVDNDFTVCPGSRFQYYLEGTTPPTTIPIGGPPYPLDNYALASYTMDENYMAVINQNSYSITGPLDSNYKAYIESLVQSTQIRVYDPSCILVPLTINVNKLFGLTNPLIVTQSGVAVLGIPSGTNQFVYQIRATIDFTVSNNPLVTGVYANHNLTDSTTVPLEINFGIVSQVILKRSIVGAQTMDRYNVNMSPSAFGTSVGNNYFFITQTNSSFIGGTIVEVPIVGGDSQIFFQYKAAEHPGEGVPSYLMYFPVSANTTYDNLSGIDVVSISQGNLFLKSITLTIPEI